MSQSNAIYNLGRKLRKAFQMSLHSPILHLVSGFLGSEDNMFYSFYVKYRNNSMEVYASQWDGHPVAVLISMNGMLLIETVEDEVHWSELYYDKKEKSYQKTPVYSLGSDYKQACDYLLNVMKKAA